jgi:two-component system response regulator AtoC
MMSAAAQEPVCTGANTSAAARIAADGDHLVVFLKEKASVHRISPGATIVIGRGDDCDVQIDRATLSRRHVSIRGGASPMVRDLGSVNGTLLNNVRLVPNVATPLDMGALMEAGGVFFMLRDHDPHAEVMSAAGVTSGPSADPGVVVEDPTMTHLHRLVDMVARSSIPVLIVGETGVGKEILSTAVHTRSPRAKKPLVRINCAALPESLLESELFGFERGAFTGASQSKQGLIESADGGTFFLDEIGEMPLTTQAKLLRVLESGEITRLGATSPRTLDVRFVAATNRHLPTLVAEGTFRRDLYYRLNGITIPIPPLRQRPLEIPHLAQSFLKASAKAAQRRPPILSGEALALLQRHSWPGNVRELKNVVERALAVCTEDILGWDHVLFDAHAPDFVDHAGTWGSRAPTPAPGDVAPVSVLSGGNGTPPRNGLMRVDVDADRQAIVRALAEAGGNQGRAAEALAISRRTLMKRLDKYGVRRPRKGSSG